MVWDHGVAGSNPVLPTEPLTYSVRGFFILCISVIWSIFRCARP